MADRVAKHVLKHHAPNYKEYFFWEYGGSDEQQYCSPNVGLPVVSVMRSRAGTYPEYHTSLDDLSFISPSGLEGGYEAMQKCIIVLENNYYYRVPFPCEPHMSKRGLNLQANLKDIKNPYALTLLLNYLDGKHDLLEVCDNIGHSLIDCLPIVEKLLDEKLLVKEGK